MFEELRLKIKTLNELMWEHRLPWVDIEKWLSGFHVPAEASLSERLHALFLLSHFSYFNANLMRVFLRTLYRDYIQYPIIARLRRQNENTLEWARLEPLFRAELNAIRFLGMGNPSESGTHLLYYFRQENNLPTRLFVHSHELFDTSDDKLLMLPGIKHLIFIDDFCGSGTQALRYSKALLKRIRSLDASIQLSYYPIFATAKGIDAVRTQSLFNDVECICEFDNSFRAFDADSRYFRERRDGIDKMFAAEMCHRYGEPLEPEAPLGFGDCQLLLGFAHNIPNNALPIFWSHGSKEPRWNPPFPRYKKGGRW